MSRNNLMGKPTGFPADVGRAASQTEARPERVIRIPKTADIVAAHIRNLIIRGELKEGDYLQPEAQLMERFTTSRPTLREAFRILENERLISVTRGSRSGARVHRPSVENVARYAGFALQASGTTLADVYEARLGIEPFAAGLAAERRTPEAVERLRAQFAQLTELLAAKNVTEYRVLIARFHLSIVDFSGNKTLSLMARLLQGVIERHQSQFRESHSMVGRLKGAARTKFYQTGMRSLETIIELIEAGDRPGAEAHWRAHMEYGNDVWLSGYDRTAVVDMLE
jgi:DNA-binding FadR family transcriptional regulator